jgi:hypothetical protein
MQRSVSRKFFCDWRGLPEGPIVTDYYDLMAMPGCFFPNPETHFS